ncbi:unnamed protein product [Caenorhabditis brenneri]
MGQYFSSGPSNDDEIETDSNSTKKINIPLEFDEIDNDEFMDSSDDIPMERIAKIEKRSDSDEYFDTKDFKDVDTRSFRVTSPNMNIYECQVCGQKLKVYKKYGKSRFVDHALNHSKVKYFKCREPHCGVEMHTKSKIQYHYRVHHGIKGVKGYSFSKLPFDDKVFQNAINKCFGNQVDFFKVPVVTRTERYSLVKNFKKV